MKKNIFSLITILVFACASQAGEPKKMMHKKHQQMKEHKIGKHKKMMHKMSMDDRRQELPMTAMMSRHQLSNMRGHLEAIQEIAQAMIGKDFKNMEIAAKKLGTRPEMTMMCNRMGRGKPSFTSMGLALHTTADKMVAAAAKKDMPTFMKEYSNTLVTCTSCHSAFKQKIVSEKEFQKFGFNGLSRLNDTKLAHR